MVELTCRVCGVPSCHILTLANLTTKVMSLDQAVKRCATMFSGGAGGSPWMRKRASLGEAGKGLARVVVPRPGLT